MASAATTPAIPPALKQPPAPGMDVYTLMMRLLNLTNTVDLPSDPGSIHRNELTEPIIRVYLAVGQMVVQLVQLVYDSQFIKTTIDGEYSRVKDLDNMSKKNIHKVRQLTLLEVYSREYHRFLINILLFSLFITLTCLAIGAAFRLGLFKSIRTVIILVGLAVLVYIIGMFTAFSKLRRRNRTDWNQLYFKPSKAIQESSK